MKKSILLISLFFAFFTAGCGEMLDDSVSKDEVFAYVNENYEACEELLDVSLPTDSKERRTIIVKHLGEDTIVQSIYRCSENVMEFSCGGSGLSTSSKYTGFYYSKNDAPYSICFGECQFIETEEGVFEWENSDGQRTSHLERIRENWFYYMEYYN